MGHALLGLHTGFSCRLEVSSKVEDGGRKHIIDITARAHPNQDQQACEECRSEHPFWDAS